MINRELIRLKVVQLVYSYYQNEGKAFDIAEKELDYSLNKAYELYEYLLTVLIELKRVAERKDAVRLAREKRTGVVVGGVGGGDFPVQATNSTLTKRTSATRPTASSCANSTRRLCATTTTSTP